MGHKTKAPTTAAFFRTHAESKKGSQRVATVNGGAFTSSSAERLAAAAGCGPTKKDGRLTEEDGDGEGGGEAAVSGVTATRAMARGYCSSSSSS